MPPNETHDAEQRMLGAVPGVPALGRGLCGIADFNTQSEQPVTKHLVVEVTPSGANGPVD